MKTLIIYATKYGATKKIAEYIAGAMDDAFMYDINHHSLLSVSEYDCIVLGSPLTAGMINKKIKNFAITHVDELQNKRIGVFLSGLQKEGEAESLKQNFPQELLDVAMAKALLGGIFDPGKCGFIARKIIKTVTKLDSYTETIDEVKINEFVQQLIAD